MLSQRVRVPSSSQLCSANAPQLFYPLIFSWAFGLFSDLGLNIGVCIGYQSVISKRELNRY